MPSIWPAWSSRVALALLFSACVGVSAGGCVARELPEKGCRYDEDCAQGERCTSGACVERPSPPDAGEPEPQPTPDAGPDLDGGVVPDGGPKPPVDAGPGCVGDALNNDTLATAHPSSAPLAADAVVEGAFCGDTGEFFRFRGWGGDAVQVIALWSSDNDRDVRLFDTPTAAGVNIGESVGGAYELALGVLPGATEADFYTELYAFGAVADSPVPYTLRVRTGFPCRTDADCFMDGACRMPLWSPQRANPTPGTIATDGMCHFGYDGCTPQQGDTLDEREPGGDNNHRGNAKVLTGTVSAYGCLLDEDWWTVNNLGTQRITVTLTNTATTPAAYILSAFDPEGNMVGSASGTDVADGASFTMDVPAYGLSSVSVRVVEVNDDPLGAYDIAVSQVSESCTGALCTDANATRYGRSACVGGACACPPTGCVPQ